MDIRPDEYVCTRTGRMIHPATMTKDDICIEDIAYALSGLNRYTGHTRLTVAMHSITCSYVAEVLGLSIEAQRWALLHDAAEAYLGDIARPLRKYLTPQYKEDYLRVESLIIEKYSCELHPTVKLIDNAIIAYEMSYARLTIPSNGEVMNAPMRTELNDVCRVNYQMVINVIKGFFSDGGTQLFQSRLHMLM